MSFTVACQACGARFALPDDLYERKFKDRLVTVRCKHCGANISVDGVELASGPRHEIPTMDRAPVDMTPTVPRADVSAEWTVSFDHDDDRDLDRHQIAAALERGEIDAETIVWREGMEEWLPIGRVPALADLLSKRGDETGGFLGTGMQLDAGKAKLKKKRAPPPHPAKRRSEPPRTGTAQAAKPPLPKRVQSLRQLGAGKTSGKARALSAGTLFVDDKPPTGKAEAAGNDKPARPKLPTAPKAPVPEWKVKQGDAPAVIDIEPPSSGTPALSDLTTGLKPAPEKPVRNDAAVFGVANDPGTLLAPPAFDVGPPTIDVESPAPLPAVAEDNVEAGIESAPAEAPEAAPRGGGGRGRTVAGILLVGGALAFSAWWFGFRAPRSASTQTTTASAPIEKPTPPPAPSATTAEKTQAPEPTESAAPVASSAPAGIAKAPVAAEPHGVAREPATARAAEKHAPASAHASAATSKPTTEPAPPTTAAATAAKALQPFDEGAAIAALNSAAGAASSCRKQGDPSGVAHVAITFAPSGRVTTARVSGPPFAGTPTGGCIAARMRGAQVPAFSGSFVTVSKTIVIH